MERVLNYHPEDMTVTVETGITLSKLQGEAKKNGQWLPIDPPFSEEVTIDRLLNENLSGPRGFGYGTIREHLLGLRAVLADGRIIQNGGKVVKNVAGFDLCKLFVGSHWSLGVVVETTFKLRPLPQKEVFLQADFETVQSAGRCIQQVLESTLVPVVLDLYSEHLPGCKAVLGLAGSQEEVEWQLGEAKKLGFCTKTTLDYEDRFWRPAEKPNRISVLPSCVAEEVCLRGPGSFVARAGNGIIFCRGGKAVSAELRNGELQRRLKNIFDPQEILPRVSV